MDWPQLLRLMESLRTGDTLVVWRLDRLGRSLEHLLETVGKLETCGVGFQSVTEGIDTTTSGGGVPHPRGTGATQATCRAIGRLPEGPAGNVPAGLHS